MPFNQQMNFPVELTLRTTDAGLRLFAEPVKEIALLHAKKHARKDVTLKKGRNLLDGVQAELVHLKMDFQPGKDSRLELDLRGFRVTYDAKAQKLNGVAMKPEDGKVYLEILVDRLSVEVFGNHGRIYMPLRATLDPDNLALAATVKGAPVKVRWLEVHELRSAWE
jgi:fructan beta-fructosidase